MANTIVRTAPAIFNALKGAMKKESRESKTVPNTRFNREVAPRKMYDGTRFSLGDFKKIRTLVPGSTINDVVLAICSGGLRRYLLSHNELPKRPLVACNSSDGRLIETDDEIESESRLGLSSDRAWARLAAPR